MNWLFIAILALLHLVAAISGIKEYKISALVMILGATLIIINIIFCITNFYSNYLLIYLGSLLIIASAIYNGKKSQTPHFLHHIIRISCFVVAIYLI
jgi:hypothetical protein